MIVIQYHGLTAGPPRPAWRGRQARQPWPAGWLAGRQAGWQAGKFPVAMSTAGQCFFCARI
eukprot:9483826-Heterocapsa_arctica.AAC.1